LGDTLRVRKQGVQRAEGSGCNEYAIFVS